MSNYPVWGGLAKAQDDPETIEEAIARMIDEHDDDADAHVEEGQSLTLHRANEVVDHPEGSVLADKESFTETIVKTSFEALDGWNEIGQVFLEGIGSVLVFIDHGVINESRLQCFFEAEDYFANPHRNSMFQANLKVIQTGNCDIFWGPSFTLTPTYGQGYGFVFEDPVLKGGIWNMGDYKHIELSGIDVSKYHVYRAVVDAEANKVYFFVDGELKGTITEADDVEFRNNYVGFAAETAVPGSTAELRVSNCLLATKP